MHDLEQSDETTSEDAAPVADPTPEPPEMTPCEAGGGACHWVIEAPAGRKSQGVCKICGHERMFRNSVEYSAWTGTGTPRGRRGRPRKKRD